MKLVLSFIHTFSNKMDAKNKKKLIKKEKNQ